MPATTYRPCSNAAASYRARPGNLVPGGKRRVISEYSLAAKDTGKLLAATATGLSLTAGDDGPVIAAGDTGRTLAGPGGTNDVPS
jgi:hypothetical protein